MPPRDEAEDERHCTGVEIAVVGHETHGDGDEDHDGDRHHRAGEGADGYVGERRVEGLAGPAPQTLERAALERAATASAGRLAFNARSRYPTTVFLFSSTGMQSSCLLS